MSLVRFLLEFDGRTVSYDLADVPRTGEHVCATGDDPQFPAGTYEVLQVSHIVALRGDRCVTCLLRLIAQPEFEPEDAALGPKTLQTEVARLNALAEDVPGNQTKGK